jgi:hypothetical protein
VKISDLGHRQPSRHRPRLGTKTSAVFFENSNKIYPAEFELRCVCTGRKPMRTIAYALALALGVAFATSAFAGDVSTAKTKADCDKAGGIWNASTNTCKSKM